MMLYKDETEKILKACINVHNELGNSFLEPVYQEALAIEFNLQGIPYKKEVKLEITYKGHKLDKEYYADFICYDSIIVELKAVARLVNSHKAQVINYLSAINKNVGLLVNFGESSLKWQRISNFKAKVVRPEQICVE
jgi:GxxExxY protein